jgi:hypothetical protein
MLDRKKLPLFSYPIIRFSFPSIVNVNNKSNINSSVNPEKSQVGPYHATVETNAL